MKTLLRIDTSFNFNDSFSRKVADYYVSQWQQNNSNTNIIKRDLAKDPLPHLVQEVYAAFNSVDASSPVLEISNELISELESADTIVISSPVYNYAIPSSLKAYIDHVVRINKTFGYDPQNQTRQGLLKGKEAIVIVARGAMSVNGKTMDAVEEYLKGILNFLGIKDIATFTVNGTSFEGSSERLFETKEEITQYLAHA